MTSRPKRATKRRASPRAGGGRIRRRASIPPLDRPLVAPAGAYDARRDAVLTGGDVDADWKRAATSGEEAVGGTVATPDQDVVDEIARALGVEQADETALTTSAEMLQARDRFRWHLERDAEDEASGRPHRRRGVV